jgi:hypothetical protein
MRSALIVSAIAAIAFAASAFLTLLALAIAAGLFPADASKRSSLGVFLAQSIQWHIVMTEKSIDLAA